MLIDRVLVKTCKAHPAGWGRECVMPKVEKTCDNQQLVNSIVTGIVVPVFGWLIVYMIFGPGKQTRDVDTFDEGNLPTCGIRGLLGACIVAIIACALLAAGSSAGITYAFGAAGCKHGTREMMVVGCASGIPGAISFIIGILYMHFSGHRHEAAGGGAMSYADRLPKQQ